MDRLSRMHEALRIYFGLMRFSISCVVCERCGGWSITLCCKHRRMWGTALGVVWMMFISLVNAHTYPFLSKFHSCLDAMVNGLTQFGGYFLSERGSINTYLLGGFDDGNIHRNWEAASHGPASSTVVWQSKCCHTFFPPYIPFISMYKHIHIRLIVLPHLHPPA